MPRKPLPDPEKYCKRCGTRLFRKRYGGTLEDMAVFRRRAYCSLRCANSRGVRGQSFSAQHTISRKQRKPSCESCGTVPEDSRQLHVHHINGDWKDHRPENLRTLCIRCHLPPHNRKPPVPCRCCEQNARKRGMCQKHYQRWRKYGDASLTKRQGQGNSSGFTLVRLP